MRSKNKSETYVLVQDGNEFNITENDKLLETPMGNPLRTSLKNLAVEIVLELEQKGQDVTDEGSMYTCLCSCLDFAPLVGLEGLIKNSLPAIPEDPVLHTSADPEIMFIQREAYSQPYFIENGLLQMKSNEIKEWARKEMATWSLQEVMVVQLAGAHFRSPLIGMALAQDKINMDSAALAFCGKFWEHRMRNISGICIGSYPDFYPTKIDEMFCNEVCLRNSEGDEPRTFTCDDFHHKCGVVISIDAWRRFATYGRNQRIKENRKEILL